MLKVYTKTNCPQCVRAKTLIKQYGLDWEEVNIDNDVQAKDFLVKQGHRAVPQMYVGDNYFGDYEDLANMTEIEAEMKVEELGN